MKGRMMSRESVDSGQASMIRHETFDRRSRPRQGTGRSESVEGVSMEM